MSLDRVSPRCAAGAALRCRSRAGRAWAQQARRHVATAFIGAAALFGGCASDPPPPDWQLDSQGALRRGVQAYLVGNDRVATNEFARARLEISSTGRPDLLARAELLRCAAQVAALQFEPCAAFERLRADASAADRAYADHLSGQLGGGQSGLLPPAQQKLASASANPQADLAALQATIDPLSRLVAAALWVKSGRASPPVLGLAVETASAQGWRRPLLAWLQLQQRRADLAGDAEEAARLQRRIGVVLRGDAP